MPKFIKSEVIMIKPNYELLKSAQWMAHFALLMKDSLKWKLAQEALKEAYGYTEVHHVH